MCVTYTVSEYFSAKGIRDDFELCDLVSRLQYSLSLLASPMVLSLLEICFMSLSADGKEFSFAGEHISREFTDAVRAMDTADELSFSLRYVYNYQPGMEHLNVGPFSIVEHMHRLDKACFENMRYAVQVFTDHDMAGELYAFGIFGGSFYQGRCPYESVPAAPEGQRFQSRQNIVDFFRLSPSHPGFGQLIKAARFFAENCPGAELIEDKGSYSLSPSVFSFADSQGFNTLCEMLDLIMKNSHEDDDCVELCRLLHFESMDTLIPACLRFQLNGPGDYELYLCALPEELPVLKV